MAKAYKEGKGWCIRARYNGSEEYFSGKATKKAAEKAARDWMKAIDAAGKPHGDGPGRTHLAQALQDYALERLPFLKGAAQDARRINTYLRFAGLQTLQLAPVSKNLQKRDGGQADTVYFEVSLAAPTQERTIPRGLKAHRQALLTKTARTDGHRRVLATKWMSEITRHDLQGLICAMRRDRIAPATIVLEKAFLSVLFNHARKFWRWSLENQASGLKLPKVNNQRSEILSVNQQELLDEALLDCRNKLAKPTIDLLRESAMRASEPIANAQWKHIDWDRRVLRLPDSKDGGREVALSHAAISALKSLHAAHGDTGPQPDDPVVSISYESLKAAWRRACERAGIKNLHLHDLRHTAATRLALKTGNLFLVKALTGHKTLQMVERYVNVKADDVVAAMDAPQESTPAAGAPQADAPAQPRQESAAPADFTTEQRGVTASELKDILDAQEAKRQATIGVLVAELSKRMQPAELGRLFESMARADGSQQKPAANEGDAPSKVA